MPENLHARRGEPTVNSVWTAEWPTNPGWWWFYGWRYAASGFKAEWDQPTLHGVRVAKTANNEMVYVSDGIPLRPSEGAKGVWTLAAVPHPPTGMVR